jgi:polar amino acid transport system substrate-binding protein
MLRLVTAELPPYCYHMPPPIVTAIGEREGEPQGIVYDTIKAMAAHIGHRGDIEFIGWTRAQELAQTRPDIGILALTRSPEREDKYRWIVNVITDDLLLVGSTGIDVSQLDNVKNRPVGVLKSSGAEALLRERGFTRIIASSEERLNAVELRDRRIDAWLAPRAMILFAYREAGGDASNLVFGEIVRQSDIYFAGSKSLSDAEVARWQQAFEAIKADGTYGRIVERYRRPKVEPLPEELLLIPKG